MLFDIIYSICCYNFFRFVSAVLKHCLYQITVAVDNLRVSGVACCDNFRTSFLQNQNLIALEKYLTALYISASDMSS